MKTVKRSLIVTFVLGLFWPAAAQAPTLLVRRYVEGDRLQYLMKGQNDGSIYEAIDSIFKIQSLHHGRMAASS